MPCPSQNVIHYIIKLLPSFLKFLFCLITIFNNILFSEILLSLLPGVLVEGGRTIQ
jgi:hypothetical protein